MKLVKAAIAATLFGMSISAFAAVSDLSYTTHGSQSGQAQQTGQIAEPRWSDRSAMSPRTEVKPFAKAIGDYRFGDISAVTHN